MLRGYADVRLKAWLFSEAQYHWQKLDSFRTRAKNQGDSFQNVAVLNHIGEFLLHAAEVVKPTDQNHKHHADGDGQHRTRRLFA